MLSIPADEVARELARDALSAMDWNDIEHMRDEHPLGLADQPARQITKEEADHAILLVHRNFAMEGLILSERMREHQHESIERLGSEARILWIRLREKVGIERA